MPFVGLQEYEAPFSNVANVQLGLRFELASKISLALKGNIAHGTAEVSDFFRAGKSTFYGAGITAAYDSFMGSIVFTVGRNSWSDDIQLAVNLGYRFAY